MKPTNKAGRPVAEPVEPRPGTKGNAEQQSTLRTQGRERVTQALGRVRLAARQRKKEQFTALLHHINVDTLRTAFYASSFLNDTPNCHGVPNPLLDVQAYLPSSIYSANYGYYEDPQEVDLYNKILRETDFTKLRALMRDFEKYVLHRQPHEIWVLWWYRIVPYRSYVKGWKISPSHYINQDLATVWLDK